MRVLGRVRRWQRWRVALPLYDGRACPDCGAVCVGRGDRQVHRDWHIQRTQHDTAISDAIAVVATRLGLTVGYEHLGELPEGRYDPEEDDDDDEDEDTYQYVERQEKRLR